MPATGSLSRSNRLISNGARRYDSLTGEEVLVDEPPQRGVAHPAVFGRLSLGQVVGIPL